MRTKRIKEPLDYGYCDRPGCSKLKFKSSMIQKYCSARCRAIHHEQLRKEKLHENRQ